MRERIRSTILLLVTAMTMAIPEGVGQEESENRSKRALVGLSEKIRICPAYRVDFTVRMETAELDGYYVVSGDRYRLHTEGEGFELICDGRDRYTVYPALQEVSIDRVDTTSRNVLANPTRAFDFTGDDYRSSHVERVEYEGAVCDVIRLLPVDETVQEGTITLFLRVDSGLPLLLKYEYEGEEVCVDIRKFQPLETVPETEFHFDAKRYKGYEMIDFR